MHGKTPSLRRGFTLIELLIVVAIIAILALIAVPNFLEAQIRSKISRAKADMRTIKTAMETYYVDNNTYCSDDANPYLQATGYETLGYIELTTPIAYLGQGYIRDPFIRKDRTTVPGMRETDKLEIGTGDTTNVTAGSGGIQDNDRPNRDCFIIVSCGPDMTDNSQAQAYPHTRENQYQWYDPTNGTVSYGDICRLGGVATWLTNHPLCPSDWKQ